MYTHTYIYSCAAWILRRMRRGCFSFATRRRRNETAERKAALFRFVLRLRLRDGAMQLRRNEIHRGTILNSESRLPSRQTGITLNEKSGKCSQQWRLRKDSIGLFIKERASMAAFCRSRRCIHISFASRSRNNFVVTRASWRKSPSRVAARANSVSVLDFIMRTVLVLRMLMHVKPDTANRLYLFPFPSLDLHTGEPRVEKCPAHVRTNDEVIHVGVE